MRRAPKADRRVGLHWFVSGADGTGGRLRERPEDFRVRELEADLGPAPAGGDSGSYPVLLLRVRLRGWDTNGFADRLADALGASRERVSWAGTKDKHAVTTQLVGVRGVTPGDLPEIDDAELSVVGRIGRDLRFGDLVGNAFEIRVTEPETPGNAAAVTDDLREFGGGAVAVPNYFGHQRFGSRRPVTHEVGLAVLRRDWREAVLTYCGNPASAEPDRTRRARRRVETEAASADPDWAAAAEGMPAPLGFERSILDALARRDATAAAADFRAALGAVPENLQRLFVNAAQSVLFNRMVSERLDRGLPCHKPVPGDVVCFADDAAPAELTAPDQHRSQRVTEDDADTVARHCRRGRAFVTAPLVGTDTTFGDSEPGEIARGVCRGAGITPDDFDLPGPFASTGTRRAVLTRTEVTVDRDPLTLSFALPSGSYATTVCREYLKVGPSAL